MLRTNLATRPFYNERIVHLALGMVAVVGLIILVPLVLQIVDLSRRHTELSVRADRAGLEADELLGQVAQLQQGVNPRVLEEVAGAAREANLLIDQRVFSWTEFFNRIEVTLPPDVMLTEVRPDIQQDSIEVTMGVIGRGLDAISGFIDALEASGAFTEVLNRASEINDDGTYRAVLRGRYLQAVASDGGDADTVPPESSGDNLEPVPPGAPEEPGSSPSGPTGDLL